MINAKKWFSLAARVGISAGILFYIFTLIPFSEVAASIASAKWHIVILALSTLIPIQYLSALRMKIFTDKQKMSLSLLNIMEINLSTVFYGLFLPGIASGGIIRWYKLSQPDKKRAQAFASIVFNRLVYTLTLIGLGTLFFVLDSPPRAIHKAGALLLVLLCGLLSIYLLALNEKVLLFLEEKLIKIPFLPRIFADKVRKLTASLNQYHDLSKSAHCRIMGISFAENIFGALAFYLFAKALGLQLAFVSAVWIRSFTYALVLLPVSISGFGVREGSLLFLLRPFGILGTDAVALSFLMFTRQLVFGMVGGFLEAKNALRSGLKQAPTNGCE